MNNVPLYRASVGLNDFLDSMRVPYNSETGALGFTIADNISYDITGAARLRDGYSLLYGLNAHSIFSCGEYGLVVALGFLFVVNSDLSGSILTNVVNQRMAYARHFDGQDDLVYLSNGSMTGIVRNRVLESWDVPAYVGPKTTESMVIEYMPRILPGHILGIFNGRMYIARDNKIYPSEPFAFSWFNREKAIVFKSRITMMQFVATGMYVSTADEITFFAGSGPEDFSRKRVYISGAIEGTDVKAPAVELGLQGQGAAIFFAVSGSGICSVDESGTITNHTEKKVVFPEGIIGSAYISAENEYIVTVFK